MGRLLQIGVLLASFVMLVGGLLYVRAHHEEFPITACLRANRRRYGISAG